MAILISIDFFWIPKHFGGHSGPPWNNMSLSIRWQRNIKTYIAERRDIKCIKFEYDPSTREGFAICRLLTHDPLPNDSLQQGARIEMLDGYNVLAVGKITDSRITNDEESMNASINIEFMMIPAHLGGRRHPIFETMWINFRWQRYPQYLWSIRIMNLEYDQQTHIGYAQQCALIIEEPCTEAWLQPGELLELCEGPNVVAIAKIVDQRVTDR
ncbi:hypothetical protein [Herpetosiphon geysericola]|uniref:Uncharacterized protein n=1 Tax=Herpetosiphon geysericola TaxID=70996 RepID=A0A0P6YIK1_9CHLR|nr:hypothetical protein [Herpetosiphon geysericola]KPL84902.1 hypothetical protein SE18_18635 [Herpetosiphon geysericola]